MSGNQTATAESCCSGPGIDDTDGNSNGGCWSLLFRLHLLPLSPSLLLRPLMLPLLPTAQPIPAPIGVVMSCDSVAATNAAAIFSKIVAPGTGSNI